MQPEFSIVIPVYNEEKSLRILYTRLIKVMGKVSPKFEIIFVNDGSSDTSSKIIKALNKNDKRVKLISFTRNFGHMQAISAGLSFSRGQKVIVMDADLQDPPEVIVKMVKKAKEGFDIIYGIKRKRKEGLVKNFLFHLFYRIINRLSKIKMPLDAGTFSLLDRKAVRLINSLPERNKYFSGLRTWTGLKETGIFYERGQRRGGKAKSLAKLLALALDGIFSFSYLPLRLASFLGFLLAALSFLMISFVIIARVFFQAGIVGWASTISTVLFIGGVQLITLGVIGEYLARIYDEVKNRPEYIIAEKIGLG